jgi:hypothetical protein
MADLDRLEQEAAAHRAAADNYQQRAAEAAEDRGRWQRDQQAGQSELDTARRGAQYKEGGTPVDQKAMDRLERAEGQMHSLEDRKTELDNRDRSLQTEGNNLTREGEWLKQQAQDLKNSTGGQGGDPSGRDPIASRIENVDRNLDHARSATSGSADAGAGGVGGRPGTDTLLPGRVGTEHNTGAGSTQALFPGSPEAGGSTPSGEGAAAGGLGAAGGAGADGGGAAGAGGVQAEGLRFHLTPPITPTIVSLGAPGLRATARPVSHP